MYRFAVILVSVWFSATTVSAKVIVMKCLFSSNFETSKVSFSFKLDKNGFLLQNFIFAKPVVRQNIVRDISQ